MEDLVQALINFITANPNLAGMIICLLALVEALAFVGLLFPGAPITLGIGALIASGALGFWSTLGWTILGAVLGDGISFWIGHHFKDELKRMWPLRNYPEVFVRGERFFEKHGGKSVILARFVGPVRPVVPVLAGMLGMPIGYFYVMNVFSACIWAPAYLLPGMAIGSSFIIAGEVAGRLAVVLGLLLVAIFLVFWCSRLIYRFLAPHFGGWANFLSQWSKRHKIVGWFLGDLFDPERSEAKSIVFLVGTLFLSTFGFFSICKSVIHTGTEGNASVSIYLFLQQLRTPFGDQLMVILSEMGDIPMLVVVSVFALIWLFYKKAYRSAAYLVVAIVSSMVVVTLIKNGLQIPRPMGLEDSDGYSFPSGHATLSVVTYGFLATIIAPTIHSNLKWFFPYSIAAVLCLGIAFSRVYLGVHWLFDVTAGLFLGLMLITILTIGFKRHVPDPGAPKGIASIVIIVFCLMGSFHIQRNFESDLDRYALRTEIQNFDAQDWWLYRWQDMPIYRVDLKGKLAQPLNVQVIGTIEDIRTKLEQQGWRKPLRGTNLKALSKMLSQEPIDKLPILPQLHNGQYESLLMTYHEPDEKGQQLVLRLWPTMVKLQPTDIPLWIGTITYVKVKEIPYVHYLQTMNNYTQALNAMEKDFKSMTFKRVKRNLAIFTPESDFKGEVLLLK